MQVSGDDDPNADRLENGVEISNMTGELAYIPQIVADAAREWDGSDPIRQVPLGTVGE